MPNTNLLASMNNWKNFTTAAILLLFFASCGDHQHEDSPSIKEARAIHDQMNRISDELHGAMQEALASIEKEIEDSMQLGDSVLAIQLARVETQLTELDVRFHDWSATVVEVPGATCTHDDHADHDHGDHAGHDHADHAGHDHGDHQHHSPAVNLEGMSDEGILEIQQALLEELKQLNDRFEELLNDLTETTSSDE